MLVVNFTFPPFRPSYQLPPDQDDETPYPVLDKKQARVSSFHSKEVHHIRTEVTSTLSAIPCRFLEGHVVRGFDDTVLQLQLEAVRQCHCLVHVFLNLCEIAAQ